MTHLFASLPSFLPSFLQTATTIGSSRRGIKENKGKERKERKERKKEKE